MEPGRVSYGLAVIAEHRHDTNQAAHYLRLCLTNTPPEPPFGTGSLRGLGPAAGSPREGRSSGWGRGQVKGHIERRFGMKWEPPVPKMRDVVLAIRSVSDRWQTGRPLDYRGTRLKLDLMTPFFSPDPVESPESQSTSQGTTD